MDLDGSLDQARQEIGRMRMRTEEEEERYRAREQELIMRIEDTRLRERKLEDQKHNLEVCLADTAQQIQDLKVGPLRCAPFFLFDSEDVWRREQSLFNTIR